MFNRKVINIFAAILSAFIIMPVFLNISGINVHADPVEETESSEDTTTTEDTADDQAETSSDEEIRGFINRLYSIALDRPADEDGYAYWVDALRGGSVSGAQAASGFLLSEEFSDKGYSDREFTAYLYSVFFDRNPDEAGYEYWVDVFESGTSRSDVFSGFTNSDEWATICYRYGIEPGGTGTPDYAQIETEELQSRGDVLSFTAGLYVLCMHRNPDPEELQSWCDDLIDGNMTGVQLVQELFFSDTFTARASGMSDEDLIDVFYRIFLDRDPVQEEIDYWTGVVTEENRIQILFDGFSSSEEFADKCEAYGIDAGVPDAVFIPEIEEEFYEFAENYDVQIERMNSAILTPHSDYTLYNAQGAETTSESCYISEADWNAIETFARLHFHPTWTPGQKALYTLYWINQNVTYASNSNLWGQISGMGYAQAIFEMRIGQCAQYNGALCEMLCYLGYDANMIQGYRGTNTGSRYQHFWCEVTIDGEVYVMETGNYRQSGYWLFFCEPYANTTKFIKNGIVLGGIGWY